MVWGIDRQIEGNRDVNLFYTGLKGTACIDYGFITEFLEYKRGERNVSSALLGGTVRKVLATLYDINQYINVGEKDIRALEDVYKATFDKITEENANHVMGEHHRGLSSWLGQFYPRRFIDQLAHQERIGKVMNREYSAEFQIPVLGLELDQLAEPILDIGCGGSGWLVRRLAESGKDAVGIDRLIKTGHPGLLEENWFDYHFGKEKWGTVISNLGFANHLLHAWNGGAEDLSAYLRKYREILDSLLPGGDFIYTPSVPFIERHLESGKYDVRTDEVTRGIYRTRIHRSITGPPRPHRPPVT